MNLNSGTLLRDSWRKTGEVEREKKKVRERERDRDELNRKKQGSIA